MKSHLSRSSRLGLLSFALFAVAPVSAGTLYENGPINGQIDAWTINFGFAVADSFNISTGSSHVTGFSFGVWLFPGDVLETAELAMNSDPFGGTHYFDGVVDVTASGCFVNNYGFDVCTETASFDGPTLNNGRYWVSLENAQTVDGNPVYWDENQGVGCHSQGCPSTATESSTGTLPSEAFTIEGAGGETGSTPEPASWLLFASGILGAAGVLRRKFL